MSEVQLNADQDLYRLAEEVGRGARAAGWRIVTAESCTAGWIAKALTDVAGSSQWFDSGYVTYSNTAKIRAVGVSARTLAEHGAVSEATVREMANGALVASGAEMAIAVSGIAGPDGGTAEKPVGTVWFAAASPEAQGAGTVSELQHFAGDRDQVRRQAVAQAIRKAVRASGGRPVAPANLHVTLAFLGSTPERRLPELAKAARAAAWDGAGEPLELAFDHLEYWRAAHLLCASPAEASERTAALAGRLQSALAGSGLAPDLKPFRPHVTVARKVVRPGPTGKMHPVLWRFTELALVESRTLPEGALYSVVESYGLCNRRKAANNSESP